MWCLLYINYITALDLLLNFSCFRFVFTLPTYFFCRWCECVFRLSSKRKLVFNENRFSSSWWRTWCNLCVGENGRETAFFFVSLPLLAHHIIDNLIETRGKNNQIICLGRINARNSAFNCKISKNCSKIRN